MSDTTGPLPPKNRIIEIHTGKPGCICLKCNPYVGRPVPALRPKNSVERKGEPIYDGVLRYFPDAIAAISRVSKKGNDKHSPGEPLHWARNKSTDQMNCVVRHGLTPEELDVDTQEPELAHAGWRLLAELQLLEERRLKKLGIRPYSGIVPEDSK